MLRGGGDGVWGFVVWVVWAVEIGVAVGAERRWLRCLLGERVRMRMLRRGVVGARGGRRSGGEFGGLDADPRGWRAVQWSQLGVRAG